MDVVDRGRRLETYCGVLMFRIILGIQVESACLAVCSLLNTDVEENEEEDVEVGEVGEEELQGQ